MGTTRGGSMSSDEEDVGESEEVLDVTDEPAETDVSDAVEHDAGPDAADGAPSDESAADPAAEAAGADADASEDAAPPSVTDGGEERSLPAYWSHLRGGLGKAAHAVGGVAAHAVERRKHARVDDAQDLLTQAEERTDELVPDPEEDLGEVSVEELILDLGTLTGAGWGSIQVEPAEQRGYVKMRAKEFQKARAALEWLEGWKARQDRLIEETRQLTEVLVNLEVISEHFEVRPSPQGTLGVYQVEPIMEASPRLQMSLQLTASLISMTLFWLAALLILDQVGAHYDWALGPFGVGILTWPLGSTAWAWLMLGALGKASPGTVLDAHGVRRVQLAGVLGIVALSFLLVLEWVDAGAYTLLASLIGASTLMLLLSGLAKGLGTSLTAPVDEDGRLRRHRQPAKERTKDLLTELRSDD